jgi:hypothetical protein
MSAGTFAWPNLCENSPNYGRTMTAGELDESGSSGRRQIEVGHSLCSPCITQGSSERLQPSTWFSLSWHDDSVTHFFNASEFSTPKPAIDQQASTLFKGLSLNPRRRIKLNPIIRHQNHSRRIVMERWRGQSIQEEHDHGKPSLSRFLKELFRTGKRWVAKDPFVGPVLCYCVICQSPVSR